MVKIAILGHGVVGSGVMEVLLKTKRALSVRPASRLRRNIF